jgi:hypothetical protein
MTRLQFPVINQRITVLSDGTLDPNRDWDCTQEVCAGILEYYTGKHFEGGVLKEILFGRAYRGGTDIHADVSLMAHYGVRVYPVDNTANALVVIAHQHIKAGHPVVITEPDPYSSRPGDLHVIVLDEEHPGGVFAMDPFIAREVQFTDAQLAAHMAVREVWIAEKLGDNAIVSISLTTPPVNAYFKPGNGNSWICMNGFSVHDGMLNFYRTMGGSLAGLTMAGLPKSNERKPKQPVGMSANEYDQLLLHHSEITEQDFERLTLRYDPNYILDKPPGAGSVYVIHLQPAAPAVDVSGLQVELDAAHKQLDAANKKIAQIKADVAA